MNLDELKYVKPKDKPQTTIGDGQQLWRASGLSRCPRLQLLSAKGLNLPMDSALQRKLSIRTGAHDAVKQWLVDNYPVTATEYRVTDGDLRCGGSIDCLIHQPDEIILIEIKTYAFYKPSDNPYWKHQVSFYYDTYSKESTKQVRPAVLAVDLEGRINPIDPPVTKEYEDIISQLNMYWDCDLLPEGTWAYGGGCKDCRLRNICTEPINTLTEFHDFVMKELCNEE